MTIMESGLVIALVGLGGTVFGALIGAVATAGLAARNTWKVERRAAVRSAADELLTALGAVRELARRSLPVNSIESADVSTAMTVWGDAALRSEGHLSSDATHVGRSVVDALAEHVGIAARAHRDPRWGSSPLGALTEDGRDTAIAYIDHVSAWVIRSKQKGSWLPAPKRYHMWVRGYERMRSEPMPSRLDWLTSRLHSERSAN
ncbi:hypothetical protein [Leifsonia shinshuensis]|uniref:Uncharacterized protein n=1 Tax=Leifsonia shinshuensis TaxID=150026 RepID=A0A853CXA6_9MICO|nr:hypothetical protein [Leifsonia shinshuensis]NYJ24879.1 hypothetical protein [Leifsonia shinshuensis]